MKIIFYLPVNNDKPKSVAFLVFVYTTASFIPKMSRKETPSWLWSQNSEQPRIFQVTGATKNAQLFTDLVNTKLGYIYTLTDCFPCRQEKLSGIARTHVHKALKSEQKPFRYVAILFQLRRRRSFAALQKSGQKHRSYV